jgi:hypothetical protein
MERAATEISDVRRQLDEGRTRSTDTLTAERTARDEAAGLGKALGEARAELDARQQWGLRRRLRWALGRQ